MAEPLGAIFSPLPLAGNTWELDGGHPPHQPGGRGRAMSLSRQGMWGQSPSGELIFSPPPAGNAWELDPFTPHRPGDGGGP